MHALGPFRQLLSRRRVYWFDRWNADLEHALRDLPVMESCPTDLYRELIETPGRFPKRTALVEERGTPIAVLGLRQEPQCWVPVTTWVVPGVVCPVREGSLLPALSALRVPVYVAWWRQAQPPVADGPLPPLQCVPTRRLTCTGNFEAYWRETGLLEQVQRARRKCAHLSVKVNLPGAAEWTLRNWGQKWALAGEAEVADTIDRLSVARYWEPRGRHFTISLLDGDRIAGSAVVFSHLGDVLGLANFRDTAYDKLGVGTRVFDAVHQWAASAGFQKLDFGGGHDYKRRWAPEEGHRWEFTVRPHRPILERIPHAVARRVRAALAGIGFSRRPRKPAATPRSDS